MFDVTKMEAVTTETVAERIARLGLTVATSSNIRAEALQIAHAADVSDAVFAVLVTAGRCARKDTIVLPAHRFEGLSRGRGWCRMGRGNSAIGTASIGSGGLITDDSAMDAWLSRHEQTVTVLGHELRRDPWTTGKYVAYFAAIGAHHTLMAFSEGATWCVALLHHNDALDNPSARGAASTIEDAAARMLVCADRERDALGIETVLRLRVIGGGL